MGEEKKNPGARCQTDCCESFQNQVFCHPERSEGFQLIEKLRFFAFAQNDIFGELEILKQVLQVGPARKEWRAAPLLGGSPGGRGSQDLGKPLVGIHQEGQKTCQDHVSFHQGLEDQAGLHEAHAV